MGELASPAFEVRNVCFVGSGYVGALTAIILASQKPMLNINVVDVNQDLISAWNSNKLPILEPGLEELFFIDKQSTSNLTGLETPRERRSANIRFSTSIEDATAEADLIFLCVDTPLDEKEGRIIGLNIRNLKAAVKSIAKTSGNHKIVVEKSTAPCGMAENIAEIANAHPSASFTVLSNPEFLAQGSAVHNLLNPSRVIIGNLRDDRSAQAISALRNLYTPWVPSERILTMDAWSSELAKIASNAFIAQRISSINSLTAICEATGADINKVSKVVGMEPRIGPSTLQAGIGFGGSCLHKDVCCLVYMAEKLGLQEIADYWRGVVNINTYQTTRISHRVMGYLPVGGKVAVLGFTFKKDTNDTRNTTAGIFISDLLDGGMRVAVYDPQVPGNTIAGIITSKQCLTPASVEEACRGCCGIVVHTDWDEFGEDHVEWKAVSNTMCLPKIFVNLRNGKNGRKMKRYGMSVMEVGKRYVADYSILTGR